MDLSFLKTTDRKVTGRFAGTGQPSLLTQLFRHPHQFDELGPVAMIIVSPGVPGQFQDLRAACSTPVFRIPQQHAPLRYSCRETDILAGLVETDGR